MVGSPAPRGHVFSVCVHDHETSEAAQLHAHPPDALLPPGPCSALHAVVPFPPAVPVSSHDKPPAEVRSFICRTFTRNTYIIKVKELQKSMKWKLGKTPVRHKLTMFRCSVCLGFDVEFIFDFI